MELAELVRHLDATLNLDAFSDSSLNGLQVEASTEVTQVAAAVDASLEAIASAAGAGAQLLLCHHGLLWGGAAPLRGVLGARVRTLFERGVSLYAAHLPLDAHPELGNNAVLAGRMGLEERTPFGEYKGNSIGLCGNLPEPLPAASLLERLGAAVGPALGAVLAGPPRVRRAAVISGAAGSMIEQAPAAGVELLITGEPDHAAAVFARDQGLHLVFLGHYATEVFGVRALAEHLRERFGLPWSAVGRDSGF